MATLTNINLRVLLGFGSTPLEEFPVWTEITSDVWGFNTGRGRSTVLDRFNPGTGAVTVKNQSGAYDPANLASTYYPDVQLSVPVLLEIDHGALTYQIFRGMVNAWPIDYTASGQLSNLSIPIIDLTPILAGFSLAGISFPEELSGSRIHGVLDEVGWPVGMRDIDVGGGQLPAVTFDSGKAIDHIRDVETVEAGHFFIAANGDATFRSRAASASLASSFTFGESGGQVRYVDIPSRAYDKDHLFNEVEATRPGGVTQTASDLVSVDKYGAQTLSISAPFYNDNSALNVAEWQAARLSEPVDRVTGLTVDPDLEPSTTWPAAAGLDLRDGITVQYTPPGGGTVVNQLVSVEGISHSVTDEEWRTSFQVWPLPAVETEDYWILGTSALDVDARLA